MSMFTDRLRNDRNPFDNYDLREQAADKIEKLEERVEALEGEVRRYAADIKVKARILTTQTNSIEALKATLRKIADTPAWGAPERWETTPTEVRQLARAALAPEQDASPSTGI